MPNKGQAAFIREVKEAYIRKVEAAKNGQNH